MNVPIISIGLYLMHIYTVIQMKLYELWMDCFDNSIVVHWIRNLVYEVRSRVCSYKIEPNYPYICVCSGYNELYIPINRDHLADTFNAIVKDISYTEGVERVLLMRSGDKIISRIFRENNDDYGVEFVKSRKHFLSIEYTHPDMKESVVIELDPAIYLVGNEILSSRFVLRCLQYQSDEYIFDNGYVLNIMDSKIRMETLKAGEYILIGNTEYEKKGLKI